METVERKKKAGGDGASLIPALSRQKQSDLCEFEALLAYNMSFRSARGVTQKKHRIGVLNLGSVRAVNALGQGPLSPSPSVGF